MSSVEHTRPRDGKQRCPLCREPHASGPEIQACAGCGTEYHRECLSELGGCSTLGCERAGVRVARLVEDAGEEEAGKPGRLADGLDWHSAVAADGDWAVFEPVHEHAISGLLGALLCGLVAFMAFVVGFWAFALKNTPGQLTAGCGGVGAFVGGVWSLLRAAKKHRCAIDLGQRVVHVYADDTGAPSRSLSFDDVAGFVASGTSTKHHWYYSTQVVLNSGEALLLTRAVPDHLQANRLVGALAAATGLRAWRCSGGETLRVGLDSAGRVEVVSGADPQRLMLLGFGLCGILLLGLTGLAIKLMGA